MSEKEKLDNLFDEASKIADLEIKAYFSRYLCVLVSGFIENSLRIILSKYATKRSHPNIANFVNQRLSHQTNFNTEKISQLLGGFSPDWRIKFDEKLPDELKNAFDTVLANRNPIVHGNNVGMSYVRIKGYYADVVKGIELICDLVDK